MFLGSGRKPENPDETHTETERVAVWLQYPKCTPYIEGSLWWKMIIRFTVETKKHGPKFSVKWCHFQETSLVSLLLGS